MFQSDRDPGGLLRRQQIVGRRRLHLDHPADRVLNLVQVMRVEAGDQSMAFVEVTAGQRPPAAPQFDPADLGRFC